LHYGYTKKIDSLSEEFQLIDGKTIIVSVVDLSDVEIAEFEKIYFGNYLSFVLCSNSKKLFNNDLLDEVYANVVKVNEGRTFLDYGKLINFLVRSKNIDLIRFAGDGGDREVSVQIFSDAESESRIVSWIT